MSKANKATVSGKSDPRPKSEPVVETYRDAKSGTLKTRRHLEPINRGER